MAHFSLLLPPPPLFLCLLFPLTLSEFSFFLLHVLHLRSPSFLSSARPPSVLSARMRSIRLYSFVREITGGVRRDVHRTWCGGGDGRAKFSQPPIGATSTEGSAAHATRKDLHCASGQWMGWSTAYAGLSRASVSRFAAATTTAPDVLFNCCASPPLLPFLHSARHRRTTHQISEIVVEIVKSSLKSVARMYDPLIFFSQGFVARIETTIFVLKRCFLNHPVAFRSVRYHGTRSR